MPLELEPPSTPEPPPAPEAEVSRDPRQGELDTILEASDDAEEIESIDDEPRGRMIGSTHERAKKIVGAGLLITPPRNSKVTILQDEPATPEPYLSPSFRSPQKRSVSTPHSGRLGTPHSGRLGRPWYGSPTSPTKSGRHRMHGEPYEESDAERELSGKVGWITLVKDGQKLVTSRLRLDCITRNEQAGQWTRRVKNDERPIRVAPPTGVTLRESEKRVLEGKSPALPIAIELDATPASFAFGGVFPGTTYANGKLHEVHRVSYSIGVAGQYLLHVRLRTQAAALPGSPFLLKVDPGPAYALSSHLPTVFQQKEVGEVVTMTITTADKMGNPRTTGGADVKCGCSSEAVECKVVDHGDGSYELRWRSEQPGTFEVNVKVGGGQVVGSPQPIKFVSTIPVLAKTVLSGPGLEPKGGKVREQSSILLSFFDRFDNRAFPIEEYKAGLSIGMSLLGTETHAEIPESGALPIHEHEGRWTPEGDGYEMKFVLSSVGECEVHLFYTTPDDQRTGSELWKKARLLAGVVDSGSKSPEKGKSKAGPRSTREKAKAAAQSKMASTKAAAVQRSENNGDRIAFPYSPFIINVERSHSEILTQVGGAAQGDYAVVRSVFDHAQKEWGEFTVDAFASEATAMCTRYWTQSKVPSAEGTDSLHPSKWRVIWKPGEVVWAHPPIELLPALVDILKREDRYAETVVVTPLWYTMDWYTDLWHLADAELRHQAGKLHRVASDAPDRIEEWPIVLLHIPARSPPAVLRSFIENAGTLGRRSSIAEAVPNLRLSETLGVGGIKVGPKRRGSMP